MRLRPGPGAVFLLAVAALVLLALSDFALIGPGARGGYDHGEFQATPERAMLAVSVAMRPGDRLVLQPDMAPTGPELASYDLYVVNGGDRYALLDGEAPRVTYVHVGPMTTAACCGEPRVAWTRPDDGFAHRAGRAPVEAGPGEARESNLAEIDQPERIDLVWIFQYAPETTVPDDPEARQRFEDRLEQRVLASFLDAARRDAGSPVVLQARVVRLQPLYYAGMGVAALVAAGAAIAWVARLQRARPESTGPDAESLLRLYGAAGAFLASLRDLLVGALLVTLLVALHLSLVHSPSPVFELVEAARVAPGLRTLFLGSLLVAYCAVVAAWLYALWSVQRALGRWRRRGAQPPLDLGALPSQD